jgi:hypothetical protein
MKRPVALVLIVVFGLAGMPVFADEAPPLAAETLVRVEAPSLEKKPIQGRIVSMDEDMLILKPDVAAWERNAPQTLRKIPRAAVRSIAVRGKSRGGLLGGALGTIAGGALTVAVVAATCKPQPDDLRCFAYAMMGVLPGAAIGAATGVALTRKTDWTPVASDHKRVSLVLAPTPGRGFKAGVSIGF